MLKLKNEHMDSVHHLENELNNCRAKIAQLQKENEEFSNELIAVNGKLRDSEQLKGHFISNITNEIINPFTSILALAENLKKLKTAEMNKVYHMADLIFEEAFELDFQLKNIFAVALIEAGKEKVSYSHVDFKDIGENLSGYFKNLLSKKNISLVIRHECDGVADKPFSALVDREKTDLILKNLVSNSIKYSPVNSIINILFSLESGILNIEVTDHGKGIDAAERQVVFDRFKQLDEKINSINTGHGLGLSIVLAYTEMLEGKIDLENSQEGGMKIKICLPERPEVNNLIDLDDFLFDTETIF
jgi:signal transduction histidine kinase